MKSGTTARQGAIVVEAPAKVNLHLGVGGLRADGYHGVETVLQAVDLVDTVSLRVADQLSLDCRSCPDLPAERNLAWLAAEQMSERFGRTPGVAIALDKAIPAGAGLGGGSSDAAAVLVGLAALWDLDGTDPAVRNEIEDAAASLGADVPFFLTGGTALFSGRGDVFVRSFDTPRLHLVLAKPPEPVPTAAAYAAFDRAPVPAASPDGLLAACQAGGADEIAHALANNLEAVASALVPKVADALAWVRGAEGVLGATVSGSGSAVFGVCRDAGSAERAAASAALRGWWAAATRSRSTGVAVRFDEEAL